ncbi:ankyrin repeat-containing protein BDA1-like [Trifolium pratense]|uniref:ankyrin repeat-containing protein BDA1-like n=1 Tax=Trifolium pratense TaxID=57577 RepID=UPI001E691B61|nr:ankyrin repeat-containing protein BDA1-like [Trifolium pratense]
MNKNNTVQLKAAAEVGNIDFFYAVIQDDPYILECMDSIPFVETPLHVAASKGHLKFATEIMMLKPSFALKLNQQGFSPIHLAMHNDQTMMVYRFVNLNKDLVRVRGREGMTPLHFASQIGEVDLLAEFLFLCPESIEYLTVRRKTALHIAIKNQQYEAILIMTQGGVFMFEYVFLFGGLAKSVGWSSAYMAELCGVYEGLCYVGRLRFQVVEIDVDFKVNV